MPQYYHNTAAPPMCPTCRHPHEQGVACEVCGHVGKAKKRLKASQWDAAAPAPKVRHTAKQPRRAKCSLDSHGPCLTVESAGAQKPRPPAAAEAAAAAAAAGTSLAAAIPGGRKPKPAELTQEPPTSGPRWLCRMITPSDTPRVRESCEDYRRIRRIAEARARTRSTQGSERYPCAPLAPSSVVPSCALSVVLL